MKKYIISMEKIKNLHAGLKARSDVEEIAEQMGIHILSFSGMRSAEGQFLKWFILLKNAVSNWSMLYKHVAQDSIVFVQYPIYPIKTSPVAIHWIRKAQKKKKIKFVAIIHDLNSIRNVCGTAAKVMDSKLLPCFDICICHNESMLQWMVKGKYDEKKLIPLMLFDYLSKHQAIKQRKKGNTIVIAGSLDPNKAGYVYKLPFLQFHNVLFNVYGPSFQLSDAPLFIKYKGSFSPEILPAELEGSYGLVWDGPEINSCSGDLGEYLRINNPHKVSLYLAAGLPIIIWDGAALAPLISSNKLGITIKSLDQIEDRINSISESEYNTMKENALQWGSLVRSGSFTRTAMKKVERIIRGGFT